VVGRVCVNEHVFAGAEDGACQARSVLAKHGILRNADYGEEVVDVVGIAVVDERDVEVVLVVVVNGGLVVGGVDADLLLLI
jgi:hypothetical protein